MSEPVGPEASDALRNPPGPRTPVDIHVIADSLGDTGARVARAAQAQFPHLEVRMTRHARIDSLEAIDVAMQAVERTLPTAVAFITMVNETHRDYAVDACKQLGVPYADLMAPALDAVIARTGEQPIRIVQPVGLAADYFDRIHAMEFAIANDDGNLTDDLDEAKVVLVGASRTGKTPLSMYLGYLGYPTANVPLVVGVPTPPELFQCDPWKIVGLTIDPQRLLGIRERRVTAMGASGPGGRRLGGYADLAQILDELDQISKIQRQLKCPVIDTTSLALEEAAGRIIELVESRKKKLAALQTG